MVTTVTPDTYLPASLKGKVQRLDGNAKNYGFYAVMVYGWKTDADTSKVSYLVDSAFGKQWRDFGSGSIEVGSDQIVKFYQLTL